MFDGIIGALRRWWINLFRPHTKVLDRVALKKSIVGIAKSHDELFDPWIAALPPSDRPRFSKDGIVDEAVFAKQRRKVLFVVLEPNTAESGAYSEFMGSDLREVWRTTPQKKEFNKNVARWTGLLLDNPREYWTPTAEQGCAALRRVAIINLKKIAGNGSKNVGAVRAFALEHQARLIEQVRLIAPDIVFVCGDDVANVLRLLGSDVQSGVGRERWCNAVVFCGNHPSLRPKDAPAAYDRLHDALPSITIALGR